MGLIPPDTLESIRSRLDIVELVREYVPQMQRAGRNMKARCPFHSERTPSFIVSPERQTFHCFGCGEGGDAFAFLMKIENLNFGEAAEKLAERAGVKIAPAPEALGPEQKERLKMKEALEFAAGFYHDLLLKSPGAAAARKYLAGRHLSSESAKPFQLGYAPKSSDLVKEAQGKGYSKDLLIKAGLVSAKTGRDYFFDRVLFPIRDARGAVVGFGARTMGDAEPKYLNSADSPVFSKGRVLYGLHNGLAAIRKERKVLLMEGYMDVIAAHQHGLTLACAPLGTALTQDHAALVKRYASEAVLVFDADSAGANAAIRGAEILLAAGLGVRIATVPEGKDPDEHLHKHGVEAFKVCLTKATDLADFKTGLLLARESGPLTPEVKSSVARAVLATIEQCQDEILKAEWTRRLAQRLGVPEESLWKQSQRTPHRMTERAAPPPVEDSGIPDRDRQLLVLILRDPALARLVQVEDLESAGARRVHAVLAGMEPRPSDWAARLLEFLPVGDKSAVSGLLVLVEELASEEPKKVLEQILARRRGMARLKEIEPIVQEMGRGHRPKDPVLQQEYSKLLTETKKHQTR